MMKCTVSSLDPCPYQWYEQPSDQALTCDPQGAYIRMKCSIMPAESVSVVWFMTNDSDDAGFDGNEIMPIENVHIVPSNTKDNITFSTLVFLAENCTFGYYWCEANFTSMDKASSAIVAVISNSSLPLCSDIAVPYDPPSNTNIECAVKEFSASEIASSNLPTTLYSTSQTENLVLSSTTVSEVRLSKDEILHKIKFAYNSGIHDISSQTHKGKNMFIDWKQTRSILLIQSNILSASTAG